MPLASALALFLAATLTLLLIPGPAIFYIVSRSLDQGPTAGIVSALGIAFGTLFHVAAAALGISALLVASATAFNVLKYVGAAYLIYLGIRTLMRPAEDRAVTHVAPVPLRRLFFQGALVNVLNPKTALFFFAFLPQFADPTRGSVAGQIVVLGLIFIAVGVVTDGGYALLAGKVGGWLRGHPAYARIQQRVSAGVYIGLGIATAFLGRRTAS